MAAQSSFYEQPVDRTPYRALWWVIALPVLAFLLALYALWQVAGTVKLHRWLISTSHDGATDALLQNAVQQLQDTANKNAQKAADQARSAATQAVLQQKDATVKAVQDQATQQIQGSVQQSAPAQQDQFQKYLNQ